MKLPKLLFLVLCISIAIVGCREDETGFSPTQSAETMSMVDLTGFIVDSDGSPVPDATVQYELLTTTTDIEGFYEFEGVEVSSEHATLQVTKTGYFAGSRTFRTKKEGTLFHRTTLVSLGEPLNFNGGSGNVSNNLVNISFPENSVKDETTGELYTGNVEVFIKHIGTDEFSMPGDLTAINQEDELEILQSYGMVFVEMYGEDGRKLNVADGMTVSMTYGIPSDLVSTAPETIKMWWYDYDAGAWREGGEATRDGNKWLGEVSHFSCWNFDVNAPSVLVNGQITSSNGVLSRFYITILNDDKKGGRGSANADGSFSGRVEAGVPLEFTIRYNEANCNDIVHQETIGPFDQDTDLGEILVNTDNLPSKPNASFIAVADDDQDKTFFFDNTSTVRGVSNATFSSVWDFGGDGTSTEENPTHTFSAAGLYNITLTITATDGEQDVITQTIEVGGASNKFASITDAKDDDTGELRLELDETILSGRLNFIFKVSEGPSMEISDGFINVAGTSLTGDFSLVELRFKDDVPHEFREGASDNTIAAANFPEGVADVWVPVEISWSGDGVTVPLYSVTVGGQSVITDAISTTNGGNMDVQGHLESVINGAMNFQWKYTSNSFTSDGVYQIDNIKVYSSDTGTETIVFQDNFEGRLTGENLNPELNPNSPYHINSSDATVAEGM